MELVYLYVDGYCSFEKAEFNFSQDVHMHYDPDEKILSAEDEISEIPTGFWGENIQNLSMIVGNNGAGKTSLMQYVILMFQNLWDKEERVPGRGILVFGEGQQLLYYLGGEWEGEAIENFLSESREFVQLGGIEDIEKVAATKLIYLTNVLSETDYRRSQLSWNGKFSPLYDASVGSRIFQDWDNDTNKKEEHSADVNPQERQVERMNLHFSEIGTYFSYEQYKQIKFVFDGKQSQNLKKLEKDGYPVPVPKKLYIDMMLENGLELVLPRELSRQWSRQWEDTLFDGVSRCRKEGNSKVYELLRYELGRCAVWGAVRTMIRCLELEENSLHFYMHRCIVNCGAEKTFENLIERVWAELERMRNSSGRTQDKNRNLETLISLKNDYVEYMKFIENEALEEHFEMETPLGVFHQDKDYGSVRFSIKTDDKWFIKFLQKYRYICNPDYFLDFSWGLSSGETNLLSMFASFYYIFDADYTNKKHGEYKIKNAVPLESGKVEWRKCNSVIIMIDEADLMYHPEWQRQYISLLTAFLTKIYPKECCENIQIILSTHSPLLLGDMPQQNVIYLKFNRDKVCTEVVKTPSAGTFGQNIHLLFKDSFFLEQGTIGQFAKGKIEELFTMMKQIENGGKSDRDKEKLEKCRMIAELIAEPIISRKLLMKIEDLQSELLQKEKEKNPLAKMTKEELEMEIERLKEELQQRE